MVAERLIFTELGVNSNKFWNAEVNGNVVKTNWGRVGDTGQSKDYILDSPFSAEKKLAQLVGGKLRKGYTRQFTAAADGAVRTVTAPSNLRSLATSQISHGNSPETLELIEFLVSRNIHAIEGATSVRFEAGGLQTPLGPVTMEGLDKAEALLVQLSLKGPEFASNTNKYLRIVPRVLGRRGADPEELFGTVDQIRAEQALVDAMRAVIRDAEQKSTTSGPVVFRTSLDMVAGTSADWKAIEKAFKSSVNRMHASSNLKLARVWRMDIEAASSAFESNLKPVWQLWHGTKDANLLSILKGGYVIPGHSSSVAITGRMFGDGVYFSDQSTKSLNYATGTAPGQHGRGSSVRKFMIFNDVAMGRMFMAKRSFGGGCPQGYDSTFAKAGQSSVMNNEMIVYRTSQVRPTHLCEFVG